MSIHWFIFKMPGQGVDGSRLCSVSYHSTGSATLGERKQKWQGTDDVWDNLARHLKLQPSSARFASKDVRKEIDVLALQEYQVNNLIVIPCIPPVPG